MIFWFAAGILFLIVVPALAIGAFLRVRRLEELKAASPDSQERIHSLDRRLDKIEARLSAVETKLAGRTVPAPGAFPPSVSPAGMERAPSEAPAPPAPAFATPPPPPPSQPPTLSRAELPGLPPSLPVGRPDRAGGLDLESLVAGRWLNYVGIVAVLFAMAFFIKYAFDNNWIGPRGRVAIGLMIGAGLVVWSGRLLEKGYRYFSEGIAGLGAAVLYVSLWAGWHYYKLFPQTTAFIGMIIVTTAMIALALGRNSERLAVLALAGGFLTPTLLSTGKDHEVVLFTYLAVLTAGMLTLERRKEWPWLPPLAFIATELYFWGWYSDFYRDEKLAITSAYATLFFVLFAAVPVVRSRREGRLGGEEVAVVLANAFFYLLALYQMLWPTYRWSLTVAVLALAAVHLAVLRILPAPRAGEAPVVRWLFAGLALAFATIAVPIRLDDKWITIAWVVEGPPLIWSGLRSKTWQLRAAGLLLLAVAALRLLILPIPATRFLFNGRFGTFAVAVACFALCCDLARRTPEQISDAEKSAFAGLAVAVNVYMLWAFSLEIWDLLGRTQALGIERGLAQQMGLSILWALYATGLILAGMARKSPMLRWQALVLFGLVAGKVFLFDLSFLSRFYRILSFLVLGVLLLLVSFLYQRRISAQKGEQRL